jgi:hypothetical protein
MAMGLRRREKRKQLRATKGKMEGRAEKTSKGNQT